MNAFYAHDCNRCRLVAQRTLEDGTKVDWYVCPGILSGSIVGRMSSQPEDYWSMPIEVLQRSDPAQGTELLRQALAVIAEYGEQP